MIYKFIFNLHYINYLFIYIFKEVCKKIRNHNVKYKCIINILHKFLSIAYVCGIQSAVTQ